MIKMTGRLLLICLLWQTRAFAQDTLLSDIDYVLQSQAWLSSGQASGLQYLPVRKYSRAAVTMGKADGDFHNYHESGNSYNLGAGTFSYYRLSPQVVFAGSLDYSYFRGKNMAGSVFLDPYKNPIDIDEYSDSTAGDKKSEQYSLMGAVSAAVTPRLNLSGKVAYTAANYAKLKDMRHVNKLLDLDAAPGLSYRISDKVTLGATYTYSRRIESVGFGIYGNTNNQYVSLINFGSFYGLAELHSDYGYTSETNPLVNNTHRVSAQLGWQLNKGMTVFQELSYGRRTGYFGERGTASVVYTEHAGDQFSYTGILTRRTDKALHHIKINAEYTQLDNSENVYRAETSPGGNRVIVYYGQTESLKQDQTGLSLDYSLYLGRNTLLPKWSFRAGVAYAERNQTVIRYPYFRKQNIRSYRFRTSSAYNWRAGKYSLKATLGLAYGTGGGTPMKDGTYIPPSSSQIPPATRLDYLMEEFEYLTSGRLQLLPSFQVSRKIKPGLVAFMNISYEFTQASSTSYTGRQFRQLKIVAGCNF